MIPLENKAPVLEHSNKSKAELSLQVLKEKIDSFSDLSVHLEEKVCQNCYVLAIMNNHLHDFHTIVGPYHVVELLTWTDGHYEKKINVFNCVERGNVDTEDTRQLHELINQISSGSHHIVCPGLTHTKYQNFA